MPCYPYKYTVTMKDKNLLLEAIDNSLQYSPKQREALKIFLNLEINDAVSLAPRELAQIIKVSKTAAYAAINLFEKDGLITNVSGKGRNFSVYKLNQDMLNNLLQVYLKKKEYLK